MEEWEALVGRYRRLGNSLERRLWLLRDDGGRVIGGGGFPLKAPVFDAFSWYSADLFPVTDPNNNLEPSVEVKAYAEAMSEAKERLNSTKDLLDDLGDMDAWREHTRAMNPSGDVYGLLKGRCSHEMVSVAWAKFFEILLCFPHIVPHKPQPEPFRSLHLCEAPGAFILALHHFIATRRCAELKWDWAALTLNPYYEGNAHSFMIPDDRLIANSLDRWIFGEGNRGDIFDADVWAAVEKSGRYALITADGSVDCTARPCEQETDTYALQLREAFLAMSVLELGGAFVLKRFTSFEEESAGLLWLLSSRFAGLAILKPATSKPGNSESYVVAFGFQGLPQPIRDAYAALDPRSMTRRPLLSLPCIPTPFLFQLKGVVQSLSNHQTDTIRFNLASFQLRQKDPKKFKSLQGKISEVRREIAITFLRKRNIQGLEKSELLLSEKELEPMAWHQLIPARIPFGYCPRKAAYVVDTAIVADFSHLRGSPLAPINDYANPLLEDVKPTFGAAFAEILSSRFVSGNLSDTFLRLQSELPDCPGLLRYDLCSFSKPRSASTPEEWELSSEMSVEDWGVERWLWLMQKLGESVEVPERLLLSSSSSTRPLLALSRFAASVIAVLCLAFERVRLDRGLLECTGRRPLAASLAHFLAAAWRWMDGEEAMEGDEGDSDNNSLPSAFPSQSSNARLLSIFPISAFAERELFGHLVWWNNSQVAGLCEEMLTKLHPPSQAMEEEEEERAAGGEDPGPILPSLS